MIAQFDKVILVQDDTGELKAIIVHDIKNQKKTFFTPVEKTMEELLDLFNKK